MSGRLGVLGGTFDPIHYGHLAIAEEARVRLNLDEVLFVPAGSPPHKTNHILTPAPHRLAMLRLATASNPHFTISTIEIDRPGPSYTVDTLTTLRYLGSNCQSLFFIAGSDALRDLITWRSPERILQLCTFVVVHRPGITLPSLETLERQLPRLTSRLIFLEGPRFDLSATELRRRIQLGLPIRYQLPEKVRHYITKHHLYRSSS